MLQCNVMPYWDIVTPCCGVLTFVQHRVSDYKSRHVHVIQSCSRPPGLPVKNNPESRHVGAALRSNPNGSWHAAGNRWVLMLLLQRLPLLGACITTHKACFAAYSLCEVPKGLLSSSRPCSGWLVLLSHARAHVRSLPLL